MGKTEKVTWKHPSFVNNRAQMGKVVEKMDGDLEEFDEETGRRQSKVDKNATHYEVDEEDEGEGGFNLQALVKKVEANELKRLEAEENDEELVESEDGMHNISKNKKRKKAKKKDKVTVEDLQIKVTMLLDQTMVNRATMKKDFGLLEGNFIAMKEMDPVLERLETALEMEEEPDDEVMRAAFEVTIAGLDKACKLLEQLVNTKLQLIETMKIVDRMTTLRDPKQLLDDCKWVSALLKTM